MLLPGFVSCFPFRAADEAGADHASALAMNRCVPPSIPVTAQWKFSFRARSRVVASSCAHTHTHTQRRIHTHSLAHSGPLCPFSINSPHHIRQGRCFSIGVYRGVVSVESTFFLYILYIFHISIFLFSCTSRSITEANSLPFSPHLAGRQTVWFSSISVPSVLPLFLFDKSHFVQLFIPFSSSLFYYSYSLNLSFFIFIYLYPTSCLTY